MKGLGFRVWTTTDRSPTKKAIELLFGWLDIEELLKRVGEDFGHCFFQLCKGGVLLKDLVRALRRNLRKVELVSEYGVGVGV